MAETAAVVKVTPGHACRIVLVVTSAVLLIPYMVLKHGPMRLDSNLVRETLDLTRNVSRIMSMRHLQAIRGTKYAISLPHATFVPDTKQKASVLPESVSRALKYNTSKIGHLIGNASFLEFRQYDNEVDLRIIVLAYNRASSLLKCLTSLNSVDFGTTSVSLHVWIDRSNETDEVDGETHSVANHFHFSHGHYKVHVQPSHVGILSQWINVWRPCRNSSEIALILEDDMTVSQHFWRWLKSAHSAYRNRTDLSGYGLSHPGMEHMHATYLDIPAKFTIYMYKVICTWGFSPHPESWRTFQEWFYKSEMNSTFLPLVPKILPSQWFLGELQEGRERNLWEMWHICFSHYHQPALYTVMLNTAQEGLLAVNRHEAGLHDKGNAKADPLCQEWKDIYSQFPAHLPKFGYDGSLENGEEVETEEEEEVIGNGEYEDGDISEWTSL